MKAARRVPVGTRSSACIGFTRAPAPPMMAATIMIRLMTTMIRLMTRHLESAGSPGDVLPEPVIDELDDLVAVPVEEHLVLVAVDARVLQADEIVLRAGLIEPLGYARVEHAVVRPLTRDRQNPQLLEVDQL